MRLPLRWLLAALIVAFIAALVAGALLIRPPQSLIIEAGFAPDRMTPNADGSDDVTILSYTLSQNAEVSLTFERADGIRFIYRDAEPRTADDYSVAFSGVVNGYLNADETVQGEVLRRLMPDGDYTWRLQAVTADGATDERTGRLTLADGDAALPEIPEFSVYPTIFTPNQDGISDRTAINVGLAEQADLSVTLQQPGIEPIYLSEVLEAQDPGQPALRHLYDYDGGVDQGATPPPDGEYSVVALAQDAVGQQVRRTAALTIHNGGRPLAQIVPQPIGATVVFEVQPYDPRYDTSINLRGELIAVPSDPQSLNLDRITMPLGNLLVFKLTVENYGDVPIRTHGSPPGTVYSWEQRASTLGEYDEAGAWRVGIDCETATSDYPWRWATGTSDDLVAEQDPLTGDTYYYLPAGARSVVWGAVRMTTLVVLNPQNCWAGLIHEFVGVSQLNANVGPRSIELADPDAGNAPK